jgi:hypothetical protein
MQLLAGVNVPAPLLLNVTVPVGALFAPLSVSLTVAVQVVVELTAMCDGEQLTDVDVLRLLTVTAKVPLLVAWTLSAE